VKFFLTVKEKQNLQFLAKTLATVTMAISALAFVKANRNNLFVAPEANVKKTFSP